MRFKPRNCVTSKNLKFNSTMETEASLATLIAEGKQQELVDAIEKIRVSKMT